VFLDADKAGNAEYVQRCLALTRPGSAVVVDNVVRGGAVLDEESDDASVQGVHRLLDLLRDEPRLEATVVQTVGAKGWDGFVLARVVT
jgi:predicted O-methyltransferase YrrM